jgi:hypothetical protein
MTSTIARGMRAMNNTTKQEDYFKFLNQLRESGVTNMFGAGPFLENEFPELNKQEANSVLGLWMQSFSEDDDIAVADDYFDIGGEA